MRARNLAEHHMHCELVETPSSFSTQFGVNRLSVLDNVPHFDLTVCLPHDIMHVILEGVLPRNCRLLLHYCIVDRKYFSINYLNKTISDFGFGDHEKMNRPRPIDRERLIGNSDKLGQSG